MKNATSLFFALLLSFSVSYAQKVSLYESEETFSIFGKILEKHLLFDKTGHYVQYKDYEKKVFSVLLEKYDPDFKLLFSKSFPAPGGDRYVLGMEYFDGQFALIRNVKDDKAKKIHVSLTPVSLEGTAGEPFPLTTLEDAGRSAEAKTKLAVSDDGTKLLFAGFFDRDMAGKNFGISLAVVDTGMKVLWEKRISLPQNEAQIELGTMAVDNDGVAYAMARVYKGEKDGNIIWENDKMVQGHDMTILRFTADAAQPLYFPLTGSGAFIKAATFGVAPDGYLSIAGLYATGLKESVTGVTLITLNPETGEVLRAENSLFPENDLAWMAKQDIRKGSDSKDGWGEEWHFGKIFFEADGSIAFAATNRYFHEVAIRTANGQPTYYFHSRYLLHVQTEPTGVLSQVTVIPRFSFIFNTAPEVLDFGMIRREGASFIFYNDEKNNLERPVQEGPINPLRPEQDNVVPSVAVVGPGGGLTRKALEVTKEAKKMIFMANFSSPAGEGALFIPLLKPSLLFSTDAKLAKVELE